MIIDRFTKFILSIIAFSLCLNALNPWISPTLANANDNFAMERAIKGIAEGINKIADNIEKITEIQEDRYAAEGVNARKARKTRKSGSAYRSSSN